MDQVEDEGTGSGTDPVAVSEFGIKPSGKLRNLSCVLCSLNSHLFSCLESQGGKMLTYFWQVINKTCKTHLLKTECKLKKTWNSVGPNKLGENDRGNCNTGLGIKNFHLKICRLFPFAILSEFSELFGDVCAVFFSSKIWNLNWNTALVFSAAKRKKKKQQQEKTLLSSIFFLDKQRSSAQN